MSDAHVLIAQLASTDQEERERAARELFRLGCASVEPVLAKWFADQEFRGLIRSGDTLLTVGVAVEPARFAAIRTACREPKLAEVPPDQDAQEFTLTQAHGVRLDILTTREPGGQGAIARFLSRYGEGIQQVECDVRDIARATQIIRERFAVEPIYPQIRAGSDGTRVNFFLVPVDAERKALIELVEVPAGKKKKK